MNTKAIIAATAILFVASACQNRQSREQDTDTLGMASEHVTDHNHDAGGNAMMASMDKMMADMHSLQKTGNSDHDLAAAMKAHHESAVEMSKAELASGSDEQLKAMAQKIIDAQSAEIAQLDQIAEKYKDAPKDYDPSNTSAGLGKAMADEMTAMMEKPASPGSTPDQQFATLMTLHHRSGVSMANTILQFAKDEAFKSMTRKMIVDQTQEIKELEEWSGKHR
ncbi:MAG: hypothetical protein K0S09_2634 [Sphingobacteriaceae bacterium]|jgi:uncharacterized protein (DUF305 family)|nr:hypothetical protein [Sphingobacteriaceae bacterium]